MKIEGINNNRIDSIFKESFVIEKLNSGRKLIIKSGIDPTSIDIHFGHLVGLLLLRDFQKLGHKIVFVLGDFTAQLGDGVIRPKLGFSQTNKNAEKLETFIKDFFADGEFELHKQSEWFKDMPLEKFINLLSEVPAKKLLSHETFKNNTKLQLHELTYPLFMAFDSIQLKPDIEVGSTEQKFNFELTRFLMRKNGLKPEDFILNTRLPGIDGSEKMSKSQNNFIGIFEDLDLQIQKILKMPNEVAIRFTELLMEKPFTRSNENGDEWLKFKKQLAIEVLGIFHTKENVELAWEIVLKEKFKLKRKS